MNETESHQPRVMINTNTYFSMGLIAVLCGGIWTILSAISGAKNEVTSTKVELTAQMEKVKERVTSLETNKNLVTNVEFFKWAIHLQQLNNDPKRLQTEGLKVPEPDVQTK